MTALNHCAQSVSIDSCHGDRQHSTMQLPQETLENWKCPICLEVLYKPCVNTCGHVFCFWCMHRAMDPFTPSQCPLCRSQYAHFPQMNTKQEIRRPKDARGAVSNKQWTSADFKCSACSKLLVNPVVLNCGHAVCEPTCRPQTDASSDCACPRCEATIIGSPSVCTQWQDQLVQLLPEEMHARQAECAAASSAKALSSAAVLADKLLLDVPSADNQPQSTQPAATGSNDRGRNASALRQRLLRNILQDFVHHGIGCDSCGLYPIKGRRYKCRDCPDKVGFDLCGKCYDRGLHITGRFNQQHTAEHKMGQVRPQPTLFHIFQAANPELSMAQIQQLTALAFARDDPAQARPQQQSEQNPASANPALVQSATQPSTSNATDTDNVPSPAVAARVQQLEQSALEGRLLVNNLPTAGRQSQQTDAAASNGNGIGQAQEQSAAAGSAEASGSGDGGDSSSGRAVASGSVTGTGSGAATDAAAVPDSNEAAADGNNAATGSAAVVGIQGVSEGEGGGPRPGGSGWAAGFIADARQAADAAQTAEQAAVAHNAAVRDEQPAFGSSSAASSGGSRRNGAFFRSWFGNPLQQARQAGQTTVAQQPAGTTSRGQQHARPSRQAVSRPSHGTEWTWNLGGPGSSVASQTGTQPEQSAEWRWNLGGPPSRPRSVAVNREPSTAPQHPAAARNASRPAGHSPSDSSTSQRPWQRRRLFPDGSDHAVQQSTSEAPTDGSRWQRIGRYLGQWLPGGQTQRASPAAQEQRVTSDAAAQADRHALFDILRQQPSPQGAQTAQQARALRLPDVPNVWDEMNAVSDGVSPADSVAMELVEPEDSVEYMQDGGDESSSLASDAMLLILHAIQARSQGRSLADDRRVNAEQYWRQMEETNEADFFRTSADGHEFAGQ